MVSTSVMITNADSKHSGGSGHYSEIITKARPDHPWPERRLRQDELLGTGEDGRVRVGQILAVNSEVPLVLRHSDGGAVGRVGGDLEPHSPGTHGDPGDEEGIGARLSEEMALVIRAELNVRQVPVRSREVVAQREIIVHRRGVGRRGTRGAEGVESRDATRRARRAYLGDRLTEVHAQGIVVDERRRVLLHAAVPGSYGLQGQPTPELGGERGLGAVDAEVLAVGHEGDIADTTGVEELDLRILPVLAVEGRVPLKAPIEHPPVRLPADLVVVERVGLVSLRYGILRLAVRTRSVQTADVLIEAARSEALREREIGHDMTRGGSDVQVVIPGEVRAASPAGLCVPLIQVGQVERVD